MSETDTVDPPADLPAGVPPDVDGDGDDEPAAYVSASIYVHGKLWTANAYFPGVPDDPALADELVNVLTAVSVMGGQGLWFEVQRRMGGGWQAFQS